MRIDGEGSFDQNIVNLKTAIAAQTERKAAIRQIGFGKLYGPAFRETIDKMLQLKLAIRPMSDADTI